MKRKVLLGSIISVIILNLVSFTSVVGYNNIKSNIGVSPLFNIRTSRAIDEEDVEDFSCGYVGKGDYINLLIPDRDDRIDLTNKIIIKIKEMDDNTYSIFLDLINNYIYKDDNYNNIEIDKINNALYLLRDDSIELEEDIISKYNDKRINTDHSILCGYITCSNPYILCVIVFYLMLIFIIPYAFIVALIEFTFSKPPTYMSVCCDE